MIGNCMSENPSQSCFWNIDFLCQLGIGYGTPEGDGIEDIPFVQGSYGELVEFLLCSPDQLSSSEKFQARQGKSGILQLRR